MTKQLRIRRPDTCSRCSTELPAGTQALWDASTRSVTCLACHAEPAASSASSVAGESAQREYDRRRSRHDAAIEQRWGSGTVGTIAKALSPEPQTTTAWAKGADGERRLSRHLNRELPASCVVLDDRQIPGTRANIDHLVIADSGIWIVDAKNYKGKVELRTTGWRNPVTTLHVGGRDRTRLLGGLGRQHAAVTKALANLGEFAIPVHSVICFTNAEWPLIGGTGSIDGVWIGHAPKLVKRIDQAPTVAEGLGSKLGDRLAGELPPA